MLKRSFLKKVMGMPFKKVAKSLTNIVVFDLAMSIYQFFKVRLLTARRREVRDEEVTDDNFMSRLKKRRW